MLTQEQIAQFHRDGFIRIPQLFQGAELEALRAAAEQVQNEANEGRGEHHAYRTQPDGRKVYYRSERMWDRQPIFKAVTVKPELLTAIGQCVGHPFLPINDSFVCKLPHGDVPIGWHQDPPCGSEPTRTVTYPVPNFDTDIYLDDSTVENGCVWGIPGHHLVGHVDMKPYSQEDLFNRMGAVPMEMKAGDVLFHALSAPHGSVGNRTSSIRRIFYVHYMAKEVLEDGYSRWMSGLRACFTPEGLKYVESMLAARRDLGYSGTEGSPARFGETGFTVHGVPGTPPHHWGDLVKSMPEDETARKKALRWQNKG